MLQFMRPVLHAFDVQVKENVAWMLEDEADGGWKPVSDDGHVRVSHPV